LKIIRKTAESALAVFLTVCAAGMAYSAMTNRQLEDFRILAIFGAWAAAAIALVLRGERGKRSNCGERGDRLTILLFTLFVCGSFALNVRLEQEGDLLGLLNRSRILSEGGSTGFYGAIFPHINTYPFFVSLFMRVFGQSGLVPIVVNQLAMAAATQLVYAFLAMHVPRRWALAGALLAALNPFGWIYANVANAELLFGASALAAAYCCERACAAKARGGGYSAPLLCAAFLCCAAAQFFRPLGVVALIAVCARVAASGAFRWRGRLVAVIAGAAFFSFCSFGVARLTRALTGFDAPARSYGWNLYVGASESGGGGWNMADGEKFQAIVADSRSADEVQDYFAKEAIARYKGMGFGVIPHCMKKLWAWVSPKHLIEVSQWRASARMGFGANENTGYDALITGFNALTAAGALLGMALLAWRAVRCGGQPDAALYFFAGSVLLLMFTEIAERYTVGYRFIYAILAVRGIYELRATRSPPA
jgi:hypothetical protein